MKIRNSSVSTGAGLTGLTSGSSSLNISTIADNEATATAYSGSNIESITTLGTFAAPTSGKVRFKEVDATNHPGIYELQIADARYAVSNAKSILVTVKGATNAAECDVLIPLTDVDPYDIGFARATHCIAYGTAQASGSSTTIIATSALTPTVTTNGLSGRVIIFENTTTTAALRGVAAPIYSNTSGGVITLGNAASGDVVLPTTPADGDTFVVQ